MNIKFFPSYFILIFMFFPLSGCFQQYVGPINKHVPNAKKSSPEFFPSYHNNDGALIMGIGFSGGGMRATAFGYGALRELENMYRKDGTSEHTILDDIRIVSGTSGGSIIATYFAYKGKKYHDLKERFLLRDPEKALHLSLSSPFNLIRLLSGGANDLTTFAKWMNDNLFYGAKFKDLPHQNAPILSITATDLYNATPFNFTYDTFSALCSDLDTVLLSDAVATSSAYPIVFTPIVISATESLKCNYKRPQWIKKALKNREAPIKLQYEAKALKTYQDKNIKYIRLVDGGLTDNISISGFFIKRAAALTPHGPLSLEQAINLRSFLYIVIDSGKKNMTRLQNTLDGPLIKDVVKAASDATITGSERSEFDALSFQMQVWKEDLINFRCALPSKILMQYKKNPENWNCKDIEINVERISFDDLPSPTKEKVKLIPTRLALKPQFINLLIDSGEYAVRNNKKIKEILKRHEGRSIKKPDIAAKT